MPLLRESGAANFSSVFLIHFFLRCDEASLRSQIRQAFESETGGLKPLPDLPHCLAIDLLGAHQHVDREQGRSLRSGAIVLQQEILDAEATT